MKSPMKSQIHQPSSQIANRENMINPSLARSAEKSALGQSAQKLNSNSRPKLVNPHDHTASFKSWLKWEKEKWKKNYTSGEIKKTKADSTGIMSMFKNQEQYVFNNTWHILQVFKFYD